ncbi:MAG: hypothetical protein IJT98_01340 [Prevotella sp.]|nr:hypothetical protein [Prevotella sp.]
MKRILILSALLLPVAFAQAQIARWLIKPAYEAVDMLYGTDLFAADSAGSKVLYSPEGRRLCSISDRLWEFNDHYAVTTTPGTANISAIVSDQGRITPVNGLQIITIPKFNDGYMVVTDGGYYHYMDVHGQVDSYQLNYAHPYSGGYASCMRYFNQRKQKDPIYLLIDRELQPVPMRFNNHEFKYSDIEFISSVNAEGVGFVVAKGKVYSFDGQTQELSPLFADADNHNQAKLTGDFNEHYRSEGDTCFVLTAPSGRGNQVVLRFSKDLVPLSIQRNDEVYTYRSNTHSSITLSTTLIRTAGQNGLMGLKIGDNVVLPPQFQDITHLYGECAVVKADNKFGLLRVYPNDGVRLSLNGGAPIPFAHRTTDSKLRIDLPPYISSTYTTIDVDPSTGITIDKARKEGRDTPEGNYVEYPCTINIPDGISETPNSYSYPMQVIFNGMRAPESRVEAQAWHYNYYNVILIENDASISQGTLTAQFDISKERNIDDRNYPYNVDLQTNGMRYEIERVSEIRYRFKIFGLQEGTNTFKALITEDGCPPFYFDFDVEYVKPTTQTARPTQANVRRRQTPSRPVLEY